jgi:hypothetical protein
MSFTWKNKSIWKNHGDKSSKYIQFKIFVVSVDIKVLDSNTPVNDIYMVTMKRHRKTFSTTAMPAVKYTDNQYYVVFDQTFLLPANMIFVNDTVRAKYAVVTVQHKEKNWTEKSEFIVDAEVFLPLHEFYLDANKNLMMPKDPSYTFTVGKNEIRLNMHVDMKEIESEPLTRSFRSLGSAASLKDLSESGRRSRSNSISSESSFISNSSFASFSASATQTPAPSPGKVTRDLDKTLSSRKLNDSVRSVNLGNRRSSRNDPRLKELMNSFPAIDYDSSLLIDEKENIKPAHQNIVIVEEEDPVMKKEKEKVEEIVRQYMLKKDSLRQANKSKRNMVHVVDKEEKEVVKEEEKVVEPEVAASNDDAPPVEKKQDFQAMLSHKKAVITFLMASVCLLMVLSPKTNPLLGRYLSRRYSPRTEIPSKLMPVLEELPQHRRSPAERGPSALIDADHGRHIPRFLRAIRNFLERMNPFRLVGNLVKRIRGKGLVPASAEVEKRAFA